MGKRAAAKAASPSKAKVAKVEDEFTEECQPVFDLIKQADLSDGCQDMLLTVIPFCLRGSPGHRHEFQHKMAQALEKVSSHLEETKATTVQQAEVAVQEVATQQAEIAGKIAAAKSTADEARAHHNTVQEALSAANKAHSEAAAAVAASKESCREGEEKQAETTKEKAEYGQLVADTWSTLKACSIPGKQWREREKLIKVMTEMLKKIGMTSSLESSLPVALKLKPEERGAFATKTVEYAEALVTKHLAALDTKLTNFEAEAATMAQAVTEAEASLKSAREIQTKCQDQFVEAENSLVEKDEALNAEKNIENSLGSKAQEAKASLETAEGALADVKALIAKFLTLRDQEKEVLPDLQATETDTAAMEATA